VTETPVKRILVLCTDNRYRSQMAEGWIRHFAGYYVNVASAGMAPGQLHPLAVKVMAQAGVDISQYRSDHVDRYRNDRLDLAITVCDRAAQSYPSFANVGQVIHQPFEDPDSPAMDQVQLQQLFQTVRDQIRDWARQLVTQQIT